jgi:outer membrane protein OmpA-like peptidoglycan-associated protein
MATSSPGAGRPGPILTIGIPIILLAAGGYFGWSKLVRPALDEKDRAAKEDVLGKTTSVKKYGTMIRVAGDPWSGYSSFRNEPRLASALAKDDIGIEYIDDEKLYDQDARMAALATGKIDVALTTVDAFLQHGVKHKDKNGLYPGVILFNIDESNGGDAIFLSKDRKSFDDVRATDKVCFATGTPSEHLWDFASLSFTRLGDNLPQDNGVVAKDCWDKLKAGSVQVAVLWQPFTAIAEKAGYPKVFATGGQADDVIVDVLVANREYVVKNPASLSKLTRAYFTTVDSYLKDENAHGSFITADCGADCAGDATLGTAVLGGIDFLGYEENACLWWGLCGKPAKLVERVKKTGRLLSAKGKLKASDVPNPDSILNDSFLREQKAQLQEQSKLAAEVAGENTKVAALALTAKEKSYTYAAETTKADSASDVGTLNLPNVYFAEGKADLDQNAKSVVEGIGEKLRSFPALCVRVHGHTNSTGQAATNKALSTYRAQAMVKHLQSFDAEAFPGSRFDVQGFGPERPVMKDGVEDKEASRRTEFRLFNCRAQAQKGG